MRVPFSELEDIKAYLDAHGLSYSVMIKDIQVRSLSAQGRKDPSKSRVQLPPGKGREKRMELRERKRFIFLLPGLLHPSPALNLRHHSGP